MKHTLIALAALASITSAQAQTHFDNFTPLPASQTTALPAAAPVLLSSSNFSQTVLANRSNQNAITANQDSGNWDMITANETGANAGRYLFMPFETGSGGVMRVDLQNPNYDTRTTTIVAPGTQGFVSGDASRWTPWGSYLTAEESWGTGSTKGRLFEVTNPTTATQFTGTFVQRSVIPRVSHEGLAFDSAKSLYFIDELNGGSIYKFVSANPNATNGNDYFAAGQTFAAKVNGGVNANAVGALQWAAITDVNGAAIAGVSTVLGDGTIDGRATANTVGGTDYQRPEDLEISVSANGKELLYVATTTTNEVYAFNLTDNTVSLFASTATTDLATGSAVGAGSFTNPDNLAVDAEGNIYIIEDRNGAQDDDIWFAKDINHDGDLLDAGEGLARWASNGIPGSEFTGLYFDKFDANKAYVNIQHPTGGDDRLVMLTAVPEPESYAMALGGLIVAGAMARRRKG
jgi:uncharacterized protein